MTEYGPAPSAHDAPAPSPVSPHPDTPETSPQTTSCACSATEGGPAAGQTLHPASLIGPEEQRGDALDDARRLRSVAAILAAGALRAASAGVSLPDIAETDPAMPASAV